MTRRAFRVAAGCGATLAAVMFLPIKPSAAASAAAKEGFGGRSPEVHFRVVPLRSSHIFQSWVDKMDLSDDQQEQISPIVNKMFDEIEKLRARDDLRYWRLQGGIDDIETLRELDDFAGDQNVGMIRPIRIKANRQIRPLLTPKQLPQFEELQKQLGREIARSSGGRHYIESKQDFAPLIKPLSEPAPAGPLPAPAPGGSMKNVPGPQLEPADGHAPKSNPGSAVGVEGTQPQTR